MLSVFSTLGIENRLEIPTEHMQGLKKSSVGFSTFGFKQCNENQVCDTKI